MIPVIMAAISSAMKECTFVFITRTIITMIPNASPNNILVDSDMFFPHTLSIYSFTKVFKGEDLSPDPHNLFC